MHIRKKIDPSVFEITDFLRPGEGLAQTGHDQRWHKSGKNIRRARLKRKRARIHFSADQIDAAYVVLLLDNGRFGQFQEYTIEKCEEILKICKEAGIEPNEAAFNNILGYS